MNWRPASRAEIREYYRSVFPALIDQLDERYTPPGPKEYGLSFREPFPCVGDAVPDKPFVRRSTWRTDDDGTRIRPQFTGWDDLVAFIRTPARADPVSGFEQALADPALLEDTPGPVPEAVYYSLDHWERPWLFMIDIDAKDVAARRGCQAEALLDAPPEGFAYRFEDLLTAIDYGFETKALLEDRFSADDVVVLYSGQGVHVYLLDTDRYHRYDRRSREVITRVLDSRFDIPLDDVVTTDPARFGRLPYSLHADVSRIVQPIQPGFSPRTDGLPPFLSTNGDATHLAVDQTEIHG